MNRLVVMTFPDQSKVDEAVRTLQNIRSNRDVKLYGSAIITKNPDGKFMVREITTEGHGGTRTAALLGAIAERSPGRPLLQSPQPEARCSAMPRT